MRALAALFLSAACLPIPLQAQTAGPASVNGKSIPSTPSAAPGMIPLGQGEGRAVAAKLSSELLSSFVYHDQAEAYAAMLNKNAATGRYDSGTRETLAKLMTDDLQAVHKDGHLHVEVFNEQDQGGGGGGPPKNFPALIQSAKWIAPSIAYIRPSAFFSTDEEIAEVSKFMREHSSAKTMIFDLRNHHGGRLGEMDVIFPYLFAAKTPLVKLEMARPIYDLHGSPFGEAPTLDLVKGPDHVTATHYALPGEATPLRKAKVYLLISNKTASAGEHFTLAMKSTGRATLIGEATAGANHFGGPAELTPNFAVWMPVGRTYDIKTGKDWEGAGIAPDIETDPKQALVVALEKAGLSHSEAVKLDATEIPAEPVHSDKLRAR
jgi:hypothetical protein